MGIKNIFNIQAVSLKESDARLKCVTLNMFRDLNTFCPGSCQKDFFDKIKCRSRIKSGMTMFCLTVSELCSAYPGEVVRKKLVTLTIVNQYLSIKKNNEYRTRNFEC